MAKTETIHAGEFQPVLANGDRSLEVVTLISGQDLQAGTVLGKITASGKYTQHDQDAADGSEAAAAILYNEDDASGGDKNAVVVIRDATVAGASLTWQPDIDAGEKTTAIAELAALGIIVR